MEREHVGGEGEGGGGKRHAWPFLPVCFRSVLKDYPFISPHILVSVVTQKEAIAEFYLVEIYSELCCSRARPGVEVV